MTLTKPQQHALKRKWTQDSQGLTYRQFRRSTIVTRDYVMVPWSGMYLGIERCGHCHS